MTIVPHCCYTFQHLESFFDEERGVKGDTDKVNVKMLNLIQSYNKNMWINMTGWLYYTPLRFVEKVVLSTFHVYDGHGCGKCMDNP